MKSLRSVFFPLLIFASCGLIAQVGPSQKAKDAELLTNARATYYSLQNAGFHGLNCDVVPNWIPLINPEGRKNPTLVEPIVAKLNEMHSSFSVGGNGFVLLIHKAPPPNKQPLPAELSQIYGAMEQATSNFLDVWATFLVSGPLPVPGTEINLESSPAEHKIGYKEGVNTKVEITTNKNYVVTSYRSSFKDSVRVIRPRFSESAKGLRLTSYEAEYTEDAGKYKVQIQSSWKNQDVSGMKIPQELNLVGSDNSGGSFTVQIKFVGCTVTKR